MRHRVVVGPEVVRPPFWDVHTLTFGRARLLWTRRTDSARPLVIRRSTRRGRGGDPITPRNGHGADRMDAGTRQRPGARPRGRADAEYILE